MINLSVIFGLVCFCVSGVVAMEVVVVESVLVVSLWTVEVALAVVEVTFASVPTSVRLALDGFVPVWVCGLGLFGSSRSVIDD
jgi:hypothetical protein